MENSEHYFLIIYPREGSRALYESPDGTLPDALRKPDSFFVKFPDGISKDEAEMALRRCEGLVDSIHGLFEGVFMQYGEMKGKWQCWYSLDYLLQNIVDIVYTMFPPRMHQRLSNRL